MASFRFDFTFSVPKSAAMRILLKQFIGYTGYFMTAMAAAVWMALGMFVVALFSQNAVIVILEVFVEWGGDVFSPMKEGGLLVFGTDQIPRGDNDVGGVQAALSVVAKISVVLYVLGAVVRGIFGKKLSLARSVKLAFVRRASLIVFVAIPLSSFLRFESGVGSDSFFIAAFLAVFIAPALFLSGYWSVFWNQMVSEAIHYVDEDGENIPTLQVER
ncbi:hypothetical protein [Marinobacter sp. THAF197a]|uniref:Uncharacterized protein n=1 Tax=Marinobacter nauticus TaxID=2743 RepID=A0A455W9Z5_MARNT|nr:hypothetical protein [Marinobacter sp. THAF197a]QFS89010.1 hypothetical protein FIV08_19375 [Marinobacter sp. THAF197a]BBJ06061.1 hypothetical protein YBY_39100 [Marinobacter nauticus]